MSEEEIIKYIKTLNEITKKDNKKGFVIGLEISTEMADTILNLIEELQRTLKCTQDSWYKDTQELETYKKIAEKLAEYFIDYVKSNVRIENYIPPTIEELLDWARKEVEKK